ncbi:MAG TPA: 4Fe-4S binding protein, partial [Rhodocyclaceae bacterium]|nr:4Fe-4S binding protein [Rhodocyclaceae bacterium]
MGQSVATLVRLAALLSGLWCALAGLAAAGDLTRAEFERRFRPPLHLAEKLRDLPAWPLTSELEPDAGPVGYVFESIDLAPIPGFEGTPFNLLIAIDRHGAFLSVEVLRQHEPVFLSGLGPQPLHDFVQQYAGLGLRQDITVASVYGRKSSPGGGDRGASPRVVLDGVTKATASVRIVNQTVLASALAVARSRLGFAERRQQGPPARARDASAAPLDLAALLAGGHLARLRLSNREADALFAGSAVADADDEARRDPEGLFSEVYLAYLNAPQIGRSLLGDGAYRKLRASLYHDQHVFWIGGSGRHPLLDDNFVPGAAPARLSLVQNGLPLELRDFGGDDVRPAALPDLRFGRIFQVEAHAGLDPGRPLALQIGIQRSQGMILPQVTERSVALVYTPPRQLFDYPPTPLPEWLLAWRGRWVELAILGTGLLGLTVLLARPAWLAAPQRLRRWRTGWLIFVLVFVGWYAQGQLSIVQLTGAVKTLAAGFGLGSFLYDPVSLLLIAFLPVSFVLWGRGTFCGWLCPFGALQELVGKAAQKLGVGQRRLPEGLARWLDRSRFVVLGGLLLAAAVAPSLAERLVEIEPFKTAITVGFDREWPYVAYAVGLLVPGAVYYKFFCRFLCPLGAFMECGGALRRWNWLPRRSECGQPCQVCRKVCDYDAIERSGKIDYRRCYQCLDCVSIYSDPKRCVP